MYGLVGREIDVAEVCFDLLHHLTFGIAKCRRDVGMYAKRRMANVIDRACETARLAEYLVTDGLRGFHPTGAFAVFARSAHRAFKRLLHSFAGHNDEPEIVE